ncbi:Glycogen [starch] synthase [Exaiptasia diaphana]|nr:Glycogen [starch] synthase [Exaiptasia diaphana]
MEPESECMKGTLRAMRDKGVKVHFGRWLIDGYPKVVLFDIGSVYHKLNRWKGEFKKISRIGIPDSDTESNDAIVLGFLVAQFIAEFDVDKEAGDRGIYHRYCLERASAHLSHVFTTVSRKKTDEAEHLLKRKAEIQDKIGKRLYESCVKGHIPNGTDLLTSDEIVTLKRCILGAQRPSLPPIVTHNVVDSSGDPILCHVRRCQLFNGHHERVKVIFHPEFLSNINPLLAMEYGEFVRGCHLGVFPSYYEPWGYTPAECTVMGIPSVTTNLSGFGRFMAEHVTDPTSYGIYIVDRRFKSVDESITELFNYMVSFCSLTRRQRIIQRNRTERLSELLDWKSLFRTDFSKVIDLTVFLLHSQFYSRARVLGLHCLEPEKYKKPALYDEIRTQFSYPRPGSAPPSPAPSEHGSDPDSESETEEDKNYRLFER